MKVRMLKFIVVLSLIQNSLLDRLHFLNRTIELLRVQSRKVIYKYFP